MRGMRLREAVEKVVEAVNSDPVFRRRLPEEALVVELRCEGERLWVEVSKRGVRLLQEPRKEVEIVISGSRDALLSILRGEESAVKLFFLGKVRVKGDLAQAYILYERFGELLRIRGLV